MRGKKRGLVNSGFGMNEIMLYLQEQRNIIFNLPETGKGIYILRLL